MGWRGLLIEFLIKSCVSRKLAQMLSSIMAFKIEIFELVWAVFLSTETMKSLTMPWWIGITPFRKGFLILLAQIDRFETVVWHILPVFRTIANLGNCVINFGTLTKKSAYACPCKICMSLEPKRFFFILFVKSVLAFL